MTIGRIGFMLKCDFGDFGESLLSHHQFLYFCESVVRNYVSIDISRFKFPKTVLLSMPGKTEERTPMTFGRWVGLRFM